MNEQAEFLKKLNGLLEIAKKQENRITIDEVRAYFSQASLSSEQMELVFDYLLAQKVAVQGYVKMDAAISEEVETEMTEEEKLYLEDYLKELEGVPNVSVDEKKQLFDLVLGGDETAKSRLIEVYLKEVVKIAKKMYHPEVFLGDLIQEGNLGLVLGVEMLTDAASAHEVIVAQIQQSMQLLLEEHTELSSRDKKMVEKVRFLDESIKNLTEELGRKVTIDELAIYMGMEIEEIEDILKLTGEETEEEQA